MADRVKNIKLVVFLNLFFTVIEFIGGLLTNSLALISDALHDFGDSITLILAWVLETKAKKKADKQMTFGYHRLSLLSSVIAGSVLVIGSLYILTKAIPRLINPEPVIAEGMLYIGILGLVVNGIAFVKLRTGHSQNEKILSWHMLEDFLSWIVIIFGGVMIKFTNNYLIDPIITVGFTVFIIYGVSKNLKESLKIFLEGVPGDIDVDVVKESILRLKEVVAIHDVHVWSMDGETSILTAHIVVHDKLLSKSDSIRKAVKKKLEKFNIQHSTLELETEKFCSGKECCFEK